MSAVPQAIAMTKKQARRLTDRINEASGQLWSLLQKAHDLRAWEALGYQSWRDYAVAEFSVSQSRAYQLLDQAGVVTAIQEAANSTMVEISERAAREIKPALAAVTAEIKAKVAAGADPVTTTYEVIEAKRSEIRPAPEAPAKPEPKPEVQVKPKKGEPTIESLQAENAQLREALAEARDNARELAAMVESYDAVTQGEHVAAKEMTKLRAQLRTVEATRDQWMTTAGELRKEVKALQRKQGGRQ